MSAVTPIKIQPAAPADAGKKRNIDATGEAGASLTPELVFALCGPIGSPIHEVAKQIASLMTSDYGYAAETIRLSELIRMNASLVNLTIEEKSRFEDIRSLIAAGDALRAQFETDILAKLAIAKISGDRKRWFLGDVKDEAAEADKPQEQRIRSHRICHIVDSVKNDSELRLLRLVYGESLLAIGVFLPRRHSTREFGKNQSFP